MAATTASITNDTVKFIECIRTRPPLYTKDPDTFLKKKLWTEVCQEVVSGWSDLDAQNKKVLAMEVRKRWLNLRTCFTRELKLQKSGKVPPNRRKYLYFKNLLFLLPYIKGDQSQIPLDIDDDNENVGQIVKTFRSTSRPIKLHTNIEHLTKKQNLYPSKTEDHIDEDKHFALSLVPSLKSLSDDEKLQAKIDILRIFQNIKAQRTKIFIKSTNDFYITQHGEPSSSVVSFDQQIAEDVLTPNQSSQKDTLKIESSDSDSD